jgi:glutamate synthase domain-containing protein 3
VSGVNAMNKLLLFALIAVISGCSFLKRNPDVVEYPEDKWEKVKKQIEQHRKAEQTQRKNSQTEQWERYNRALNQLKGQDQGLEK